MSQATEIGVRRSNVIVSSARPGAISEAVRGRQIESVLSTDEQVLLQFSDGMEIRIGFYDDGRRVSGKPMLDDVRRWR